MSEFIINNTHFFETFDYNYLCYTNLLPIEVVALFNDITRIDKIYKKINSTNNKLPDY
jgi:hypothetical protein